MVSCPRPAWIFFVILFPLHRFASPFSSPPPVFLWHRRRFVDICAFPHAFPPHAKTPPAWFPLFSCESFHFSFIRMPLRAISAAQSLPEWPGTTRAAPPPPPSG